MSRQTLNLTTELYQYLLDTSVREPGILQQLREATARLEQANMQISPEQGQFMHWLVSLIAARKILEVGTFTGYSALWMALALPDDGKLVCCDINGEWTKIAQDFWRKAGQAAKIHLHLAPAVQTLQHLLAQGEQASFDAVFIDANKEDYLVYYDQCLELLRPGGVAMIDNTLWGGNVINPSDHTPATQTIRKLNRRVMEDRRIDSSLLPLGDGLTLIRKR